MAKIRAEWEAEGEALFGEDKMQWKFVCPNCGHVQCPEDFRKYQDKGANPSDAYFNCIGRFMADAPGTIDNRKSPCDYTQGGLFILSRIVVIGEDGTKHKVFDFYRGETNADRND